MPECLITEEYNPRRTRNKSCMTDSRRKEWSVAFQEIKKGGDENDQKVKTFTAGWLGVCT